MAQIAAIRRREAAFIRRTARIKAFNMGLSASIIPLVGRAAGRSRCCCLLSSCRCCCVPPP